MTIKPNAISGDSTREKLTELFNAFPLNTRIQNVPIYDDKATEDAIENAISEDIFSDIDALIQDVEAKFKDGSITRRVLDGRKTEALEILTKIKVHEKNLRSQAKEVRKKLGNVAKALDAVTTKVESTIFDPADFYKELEKSMKL